MDNQPESPRKSKRPRPTPYLQKIDISEPAPVEIKATDFTDKVQSRERRPNLSGPWVLIVGFATIILIGTLLLKLPIASSTGNSITWSEAFFTSTSATTVTGLVVLNTANDFTFFGQVTILILLQVGGVGFIAFSVLLLRLIGRRITLQARFLVQQSLGRDETSGVLRLALYVLGITLLLEGVGALLLWLRWRDHLPTDDAIWYAIFHAISSYCNAGFDLFGGTSYQPLFGFGTDWFTLSIMGLLITLGSFGITVTYDLWAADWRTGWSLGTRFTLVSMLVLTLLGAVAIFTDPNFHHIIFPDASLIERASAGLFTVVSARTAGLTILPLAQLSESSQVMILVWMFIGGAPASMAGGVGTSTIAVLLAAVLATAKGYTSSVSFGRTLPTETIAKAVAIMTVSTLLIGIVTMILSYELREPIFAITFEVVSAFANAGYSLDFTDKLSGEGRFLIALAMFWGRLGPLTIVVALAQSEHPTLLRYPAEPVILG